MKKIAGCLLLLNNAVFAQSPTQQIATRFDKFINIPGIEWAAYINDTTRFEKINLNKILLTRFSKNEIKASLPVGSGSPEADGIKYMDKKSIDAIKFQSTNIAVYDSQGNMTGTEHRFPVIDTASFTLTDVTQILYVENGQLKTYTPWVAAMLPVVTSSGIYLGEGDYFSTCFNYDRTYQATKQSRVLFLLQLKRKIRLDSFDVRSKLKELYGRNIVQTLWPYILKNRFGIFDCAKNKPVKAEDLDAELVNGPGIPTPIYDTLGNLVGSRVIKEPIQPEIFSSMELVQDWYYDHSKNIVFSTPRELYLYAKKWTADGEAKDAAPILKIVFK